MLVRCCIDIPYKWALMVREPMTRWTSGNATLLGDACHPTLPFLAQGAGMAIDDENAHAAADELIGEHQPGGAGADDENVGIHRGGSAAAAHAGGMKVCWIC